MVAHQVLNGLNTKLDEIFAEWESSNPQYHGRFTRDGIINEQVFQTQKLKLLFIAKEPNQSQKPIDEKPEDYRIELSDLEIPKDYSKVYSYRIAEWAYGILNDFPPFENFFFEKQKNKLGYNETLQKIAFMNVKKIGGAGASNAEEINQYVIRDQKYLISEINLIDPDIIVLGLGLSQEMRASLFPDLSEVNWMDCGFSKIKVARWHKTRIIDFYHPSVRPVHLTPQESYALLKNIFHSETFRKL